VRLDPAAPAQNADMLRWEKDLLGVYVSGHPLEKFREELKKRPSIKSLLADGRNGIPAVAAGIIEEMKEIMTKGGEHMAFIRLADLTGAIEIVVFPKTLKEKREVFQPQSCIAVKGRLSLRNGEPSIVVDAAKSL
jgi:DNA polymerase-3 subunit alpha